MISVQGARVERVEVDVTPEELIKGLQKYFNLFDVCNPPQGVYWKYTDINGKRVLVKMTDLSICVQASGKQIRDERKLKAYDLLMQLEGLIEEDE